MNDLDRVACFLPLYYTLIMIKSLIAAIAAIQVLDILVHAATNQLEVLRVSSNIIILAWLITLMLNKANKKSRLYPYASLGIYLVLNILFLTQEGLINASQGGGLRVALLLFVSLTMISSIVFATLATRRKYTTN